MASSTDKVTIYVRLLDEGVEVFRPTLAEAVGQGRYRLLATPDYDPEDEKWEFTPGTVVAGSMEKRQGKNVLIARRA
jgi:hypothetical protein